ncbi:MAG: hypothetical protein WD403_16240 [Pirellulales bacterium]
MTSEAGAEMRSDPGPPGPPSGEERRSTPRGAPKVKTLEFRMARSGQVVDESPAGLALLIESAFDLRIGQQIEINYVGFPLRAEIRNLELTDEGKYRLGVRWVDPFVIKWLNSDLLSNLAAENSWLKGEPTGMRGEPLAAADWDAFDI